MSPPGNQPGDKRQCVYCGKLIDTQLTQCPFCREAVPQVRLSRSTSPGGRAEIRRGLLYMLLAAVIHYFSGGYAAPLKLPVEIAPLVTQYLSPLLFLGGLGLTLYGVYRRVSS